MKNLILAILILISVLSPSRASFKNEMVTVPDIKLPKKVQNTFDQEKDNLFNWFFLEYRAFITVSGVSVSRTHGGNFYISFDVFNMGEVFFYLNLHMVIKPNGELVESSEIPVF